MTNGLFNLYDSSILCTYAQSMNNNSVVVLTFNVAIHIFCQPVRIYIPTVMTIPYFLLTVQ